MLGDEERLEKKVTSRRMEREDSLAKSCLNSALRPPERVRAQAAEATVSRKHNYNWH